ncbi:MAG: PIN domain-containing protein [Balneola sp.]
MGINFPDDAKEEIRKSFLSIEGFGRLGVSVVIDNNFAIAQIRGFLKQGKKLEDSFIQRLLNSVFVEVYAPYKFKEELYEKIEIQFPDQLDEAKEYAQYILSRVIIRDAYFVENWIKAKRRIGDIDSDDIPYLALAIDIKGQAIISLDKVFDNQDDVKVWEMRDAGRVMASFSQGIVSVGLIGTGAVTLHSIYHVISYIFKIIIEILNELLSGIIAIFNLVFSSASHIPKEVWLGLLATAVAGLFFSEDLRQKGKDKLDKAIDNFKTIIQNLREYLSQLKEDIMELWKVFSPVATISGQILLFLFAEVNLMLEELTALDLDKELG